MNVQIPLFGGVKQAGGLGLLPILGPQASPPPAGMPFPLAASAEPTGRDFVRWRPNQAPDRTACAVRTNRRTGQLCKQILPAGSAVYLATGQAGHQPWQNESESAGN